MSEIVSHSQRAGVASFSRGFNPRGAVAPVISEVDGFGKELSCFYPLGSEWSGQWRMGSASLGGGAVPRDTRWNGGSEWWESPEGR